MDSHDRDRKIAKNEAKREMVSDARISIWAVSFTIIVVLAAAMIYLLSRQ